jgi:hypothetical protein
MISSLMKIGGELPRLYRRRQQTASDPATSHWAIRHRQPMVESYDNFTKMNLI